MGNFCCCIQSGTSNRTESTYVEDSEFNSSPRSSDLEGFPEFDQGPVKHLFHLVYFDQKYETAEENKVVVIRVREWNDRSVTLLYDGTGGYHTDIMTRMPYVQFKLFLDGEQIVDDIGYARWGSGSDTYHTHIFKSEHFETIENVCVKSNIKFVENVRPEEKE